MEGGETVRGADDQKSGRGERGRFAPRLPVTDRERALATRGTFLFHLRPIRVSRAALRWSHTLGLGGSSLVLWLALAATGILMLLAYQPVPEVAYDSVRTLEDDVRFGPLVRGAHYWGANLLIAVVILHVARVVLTAGYLRPRRLNWVIGAALLVAVLASAFTGYLLTWDQRAFWAVTISTGMLEFVPLAGDAVRRVVLGGPEIGAVTLLRFFTYHTTFLPVVAIVLMAFHFWRVRKAGGVVEPPNDGAAVEKVSFLPDLLLREVAQALIVLAVVVALGAFVGAPFGERASPGMSPNPAKAPWYFMGFQELLVHVHPVFAVLVLPAIVVVGFVALPWLGDDDGPSGAWFLTAAARRAAGIAAAAGVLLTAAVVSIDERLVGATGGASGWVARGLLPTLVLGVLAGALVAGARRRLDLGRNESVQTAVVFLFSVFATLTVIGTFFRGEGMKLTLPWSGG